MKAPWDQCQVRVDESHLLEKSVSQNLKSDDRTCRADVFKSSRKGSYPPHPDAYSIHIGRCGRSISVSYVVVGSESDGYCEIVMVDFFSKNNVHLFKT